MIVGEIVIVRPWLELKLPLDRTRRSPCGGIVRYTRVAQEIEKALSLREGHFGTIDGGFEDLCRFELAAEVPKLFLRVSMPEELKAETISG
jgi:hypothetical protein